MDETARPGRTTRGKVLLFAAAVLTVAALPQLLMACIVTQSLFPIPAVVFLVWSVRRFRASFHVAGWWLLVACAACIALTVLQMRAAYFHGNKYILPEGYVGMVTIRYEVKGAPPLPETNGQRTIRIPPRGYLATSSREEDHITTEHFYVQTHSGLQEMNHQGPIQHFFGNSNQTWFFVGTEKQWNTAGLAGGAGPYGPRDPATLKPLHPGAPQPSY